MKLIQTKSFKLATLITGSATSSKLALVLPGKLDTKDYPHIKSHTNYLAEKGFLSISFDPPGTWESPGGLEIYSTSSYLKAIGELIAYFDNRPTFIMGHSRGASLSIFSAIRYESIKSFAAVFPSYAYTPEVVGGYPNLGWKSEGYISEIRELPSNPQKSIVFSLPYAFLEDQIKYDASSYLPNLKKPKLFIYGTNDTLVEPDLVKKAYEMSAEPKEITSIFSDHDYRYKQDLILEVNKIVGNFVDRYWPEP